MRIGGRIAKVTGQVALPEPLPEEAQAVSMGIGDDIAPATGDGTAA